MLGYIVNHRLHVYRHALAAGAALIIERALVAVTIMPRARGTGHCDLCGSDAPWYRQGNPGEG